MNISVRYMLDLRRSVRLNLYLRRKAMRVFMALGALLIILGVVSIGASTAFAAWFIAIGVLLVIEVPLLTWVQVYANRKNLLEEVEVTLTSEGINQRTATTTLSVTWDMVERIHERHDLWIFVVNRLKRISLFKQALTPEQQAELAVFIAARTG